MAGAKSATNVSLRGIVACVLVLVSAIAGSAQTKPGPASEPAATPAQSAPPTDPLGRTTPRRAVLGFLSAARKGENEVARQYLDTRLGTKQAEELTQQLFVVLDARLPARLTQISDLPEGSRSNPLSPTQDVVGTIDSGQGPVDIVVERISNAKIGSIWLFSGKTLEAVPALYAEVVQNQSDTVLHRLQTDTRIGGTRLYQWFAVLFGIAAFYILIVLLNRILTPLVGRAWNRVFGRMLPWSGNILPTPIRLLILALASRWLLGNVSLSLFVRQFWSSAAGLVTIAAVVWLLILLNGAIERYLSRHLPRTTTAAATSLLRLARRAADALVLFFGLLATLRLFAVDATPALAGLGVGGIAVALAAQKTLENVIAGASLIFDQAVKVGDFLKMGEVTGTVDQIGLRSTRIRTVDRTVVSIPNGQIANASLETLSSRDKFWFHHVVGVRYETTSQQLRDVVDGIRRLLSDHPLVDVESVRVRFVRLGAFSLDVDVFAYFRARDWNHFLEIQEALLFGITEIVSAAGTEIAFPSQTMYVQNAAVAQHAAGGPSR